MPELQIDLNRCVITEKTVEVDYVKVSPAIARFRPEAVN